MTHGDDDGIVLPPKIASSHVVLLPIIRKDKDRQKVMEYTKSLSTELQDIKYHDRMISVEIDDRDIGGARGWDWIKRGIPLRVEIGPRDIADHSVFVGRRDHDHKNKKSIKRDQFVGQITDMLDDIQKNLFDRALSFKKEHTIIIDDSRKFNDYFTSENQEKPEIHGGFALAFWCGSDECESKIKEDLKVTIRCIPFESDTSSGKCICCGKSSTGRVVFAKAY